MRETTASKVTRIQSRLNARARKMRGDVSELAVSDLRDALNDLLDLTALVLSSRLACQSSRFGRDMSRGSRQRRPLVRTSLGVANTGYPSSGVITANTLRGLR